MSHPPTTPDPTPQTCASCATIVTGRFCPQCGTPAGPQACASCQTVLSPGARFCHRCGTAAGSGKSAPGSRERNAWIFSGVVITLAALLGVWRLGGGNPTVPDMGNAGNVGTPGGVAPVAGRAPDISSLSPRERFDRLYQRVMTAAEGGDSVTVSQFIPMALASYTMLDSVNADARYHAGMLNIVVGNFEAANALADTILTKAPGHLFGFVVRGEAADRSNQPEALTRAYRGFLQHFDSEIKAGRVEYQEHRPALDDFRTRARASLGQ